MKLIASCFLVVFCSAALADHDTEKWIGGNGSIHCNESCDISSGPGCTSNEGAKGQCSFPALEAKEMCLRHPQCVAINCSNNRTDCQARSESEASRRSDRRGPFALHRHFALHNHCISDSPIVDQFVVSFDYFSDDGYSRRRIVSDKPIPYPNKGEEILVEGEVKPFRGTVTSITHNYSRIEGSNAEIYLTNVIISPN